MRARRMQGWECDDYNEQNKLLLSDAGVLDRLKKQE
jgi:hypothetical protein